MCVGGWSSARGDLTTGGKIDGGLRRGARTEKAKRKAKKQGHVSEPNGYHAAWGAKRPGAGSNREETQLTFCPLRTLESTRD